MWENEFRDTSHGSSFFSLILTTNTDGAFDGMRYGLKRGT